MSRTKVCIVNASKHVFGAEKSLASLVEFCRHECDFLLLSSGGATESLLRSAGCIDTHEWPIQRLGRHASVAQRVVQTVVWARGTLHTYGWLRSMRPDVVHANGIQSMLYAAPAAKILGIPVIWHIRDLHMPKRLSRICSGLSSEILVASEHAAKHYAYLKRPLRRLPNLVSMKHCAELGTPSGEISGPADSTFTPQTKDTFRIGIIGQVIPRKGHLLLLDAFALLSERFPGAEIHVIGDDPFDPNSAYLAKLREQIPPDSTGSDSIFFHGYTEAVDSVYGTLDVVVIPSLDETFGRVALESMAHGCPVVASNVGGLAENIQHGANGLLFEAGNAESLARTLASLAESPETQTALAHNGIEYYSSYSRIAEQAHGWLISLYKSISTAAGCRDADVPHRRFIP